MKAAIIEMQWNYSIIIVDNPCSQNIIQVTCMKEKTISMNRR